MEPVWSDALDLACAQARHLRRSPIAVQSAHAHCAACTHAGARGEESRYARAWEDVLCRAVLCCAVRSAARS